MILKPWPLRRSKKLHDYCVTIESSVLSYKSVNKDVSLDAIHLDVSPMSVMRINSQSALEKLAFLHSFLDFFLDLKVLLELNSGLGTFLVLFGIPLKILLPLCLLEKRNT